MSNEWSGGRLTAIGKQAYPYPTGSPTLFNCLRVCHIPGVPSCAQSLIREQYRVSVKGLFGRRGFEPTARQILFPRFQNPWWA